MWNNKLFFYMSSSRWTSEIGDWFNYLVLVVILQKYQYISYMIIARNLLPLFFSPLIGNIVEKSDKIKLIMITEIIVLSCIGLLFFAYVYRAQFWYMVYINVIINAICWNIKNSCYLALLPSIVSTEMIEEANKIHNIAISLIYVLAISVGGVIIVYAGGLVNLIINTICYIIAIALLFNFRKMYYKLNNDEEQGGGGGGGVKLETLAPNEDIKEKLENLTTMENLNSINEAVQNINNNINNNDNDNVVPIITFSQGVDYLYNHKKFMVLIAVNALIYYIYGIFEIINYKLGFEDYNLLELSLVMGLSTTGTVLLFFYKQGTTNVVQNYFFFIISCIIYALLEFFQPANNVGLWFFALWLFSYIHYAFWIMINSLLQREVNENFRGRIFTYNATISYAFYALGSLTGSYLLPLHYWIIIGIFSALCGVCLFLYKYKYVE